VEDALLEDKKRLRASLSDSKAWKSSVGLSSFFDFFSKDLYLKPVGLYKPLKDEIELKETSMLMKPAWPKLLDAANGSMFFSHAQKFSKSFLGFEEPSGDSLTELSKDEMGVIFVPGMAFDYKGARLGRGRGFYDRYLSDYKGLKVGVCHHTRFLNKPIPVDLGHDIFMDYILTDKHVFKVNNNAITQMNEVV